MRWKRNHPRYLLFHRICKITYYVLNFPAREVSHPYFKKAVNDDDPKNEIYDFLMKSAPGSKNKKKKGKSNIK